MNFLSSFTEWMESWRRIHSLDYIASMDRAIVSVFKSFYSKAMLWLDVCEKGMFGFDSWRDEIKKRGIGPEKCLLEFLCYLLLKCVSEGGGF